MVTRRQQTRFGLILIYLGLMLGAVTLLLMWAVW